MTSPRKTSREGALCDSRAKNRDGAGSTTLLISWITSDRSVSGRLCEISAGIQQRSKRTALSGADLLPGSGLSCRLGLACALDLLKQFEVRRRGCRRLNGNASEVSQAVVENVSEPIDFRCLREPIGTEEWH